MNLSIIIPAFNEAARIESCLRSVFTALQANARDGFTAEVIVVDNNSTDATADLARQAGARVVFEPVNQIARARNAGAAIATGDWFLFLDADTLLPAASLTDALAEMQKVRVVGGGSTITFVKVGLRTGLFLLLCNGVMRLFKMTAGCFIFCRADAFRAIGGFNETYFAGEDAELGKALKRYGRQCGLTLTILHHHPPVTSDRKFHLYGGTEILRVLTLYLLFPRATMTSKRHLKMFYDGRR